MGQNWGRPVYPLDNSLEIVAHLLKERTVEPEKQPLLGNGCVIGNNRVTIGSGVFYAVRADII
jgi:hypothetical protein